MLEFNDVISQAVTMVFSVSGKSTFHGEAFSIFEKLIEFLITSFCPAIILRTFYAIKVWWKLIITSDYSLLAVN